MRVFLTSICFDDPAAAELGDADAGGVAVRVFGQAADDDLA